jgi:hypothetical protein
VPTLPSSLILSAAERVETEQHIRALEASYGPVPADHPEMEGVILIELTRLMLALPAAKQNEASVEARGEAYLAALDDMPLWAVRAAIRRWYRGDAGLNERGAPHDYHWCPAPAELRKIAACEIARIRARVADLRRLLRAEPLIEFSGEHCDAMRTRLAKLMHKTFDIPPVGKDGSGGTISDR